MDDVEDKTKFLSDLSCTLIDFQKTNMILTRLMSKKRELYFGGNISKMLNIPETLISEYDQVIRDQNAIIRRTHLVINSISKENPACISDERANQYGSQALDILASFEVITETELSFADRFDQINDSYEHLRCLLDKMSELDESDFELADDTQNDDYTEFDDTE